MKHSTSNPILTYRFISKPSDCDSGPLDDDWVIVSPAWDPPYLTRAGGGIVGRFDSVDAMCQYIERRNEKEQYWPAVWHLDERGNLDLCVIETVENGLLLAAGLDARSP